MKIVKWIGMSKSVIGTNFDSLNGLLKAYIQQKDYWPPFLQKFKPKEQPTEDELKHLFIELMQHNFTQFYKDTEMQKIILWQISEDKPMLRGISEAREKEGAKLFELTVPYFIKSDVNFKAVIAMLLGGSYNLVLHAAANKSTVCGIDANWEHDREQVLKTIGQIIGWAWDQAKENQSKSK